MDKAICSKCGLNPIFVRKDGTHGKLCASCVVNVLFDLVRETEEDIDAEVKSMTPVEIQQYLQENNISTEPRPDIKQKLQDARDRLKVQVLEEQNVNSP